MSNQPSSSSSNSAPATPSSSKPQGKTQVFILTPDLLKKLGIASKIPSLTAAKSSATVSSPKSTILIKNINVADTTKSKLASSLNKKINESNETTNIIETCSKDVTKQNEKEKDSVKTKLLSMLTSKLEKEKAKSTSSSLETKNDKQTNIKIQIDPKKGNNINEIETIKGEPDSNINKLCKNDVKTNLNEIITKHDSVQNINESVENIQSVKIAQPNTKENTHRDIKPSLESTSLLKNTLSGESKSEIKREYGNISSTEDNNTVVSIVNKDKTCETDAHDKIKSKETNESIETPSEMNTATSKQRKRKLSEENLEDSELVSPIRKSARKRKLSTLHSDYVTELKLHDGSSQKLLNKNKKSIEIKSIECPKQNIQQNVTDLNENNNMKLENNVSTNEPENMKQNNETRVADMEEKTNNTNSNIPVSQDAEKIDKSCLINQNLTLTNNVLFTPVHNIRIITNNESNNNMEQLLTTGSLSSRSTSNTELNKPADGNALQSPKKQIIIHENILIKSPKPTTISNLNIELTNQESAKTESIEKLELNNTNIKVRNEASVNDANLDFKIPVLKTCSKKTKRKLSTDAQPKPILELRKPELTPISTPEVHQNKNELTKCPDVSNNTIVIDTVTKVSDSSDKIETNKNIEIKSNANCTPTKNVPDQPKMDRVDNINKSPVVKTSTQETKQETKPPPTIDVEICTPIKNTPDQPKLDSIDNINKSQIEKPSTQETKQETKTPPTIEVEICTPIKNTPDQPKLDSIDNINKSQIEKPSTQETKQETKTPPTIEVEICTPIKNTPDQPKLDSIDNINKSQIEKSSTQETKAPPTDVEICTPIKNTPEKPKLERIDNINKSQLEEPSTQKTKQETKAPPTTDVEICTPIKNTPDEQKLDINNSPVDKPTTQEIKLESKSPQTIVLVRRRRSRPGKDNSGANTSFLMQENNSANLSDFETFYSSVTSSMGQNTNDNAQLPDSNTTPVKQIQSIQESQAETILLSPITKTNTSQNTTKANTKPNPETSTPIYKPKHEINEIKTPEATPIRRRGRKPKETKSTELVNITETKTVKSNPNEKCDNIKQDELSKSETTPIMSNSKTTPISTPIYKIKRQRKQEISDDSVNDSKHELENLLTDIDIETPVTTPIRRRVRKPKEIKNRDSVNISEAEAVETIPNVKQDELSKSETIIPVRRRGRPAKEKKNLQYSVNILAPNNSPCTEIETNEPTEAETAPVKQRRAQRKKTVAVVEKVEQVEEKSTKVKSKYLKPPARGRKRDRQEMIESKTENKSKEVTCAVCKVVLERTQWSAHTLKHNFLCWQVGEPELNINDRKTVEYVLFKGLKENNKFKHFNCPTCSDKKRSVLGFLSHLEICQLTEEERLAIMETCTICSKKVMPQSMKSHMKIHENYLGKGGINEQPIEEDTSQRSKRKAATKAANLIQEVSNEEDAPVIKRYSKPGYKKGLESCSVFMSFGIIKKIQADFKKGSNKCKFKRCNFQCNNFDEMKDHLNACPTIKNDDYICRYCLYIDKNENKMKEHIMISHLTEKEDYKSDASVSDSEDDDYFDDEINQSDDDTNNLKGKKLSKPSSEYIRPTFKIGFLARERRIIRDPVCSYLPALRWTLEFCRENYKEVLFENIKCLASKWITMPLNEQEKYMPLVKKSMSVKTCSIANKIPNFQRQEHDWKEYDLYETSLDSDAATIFCGGPIWALAWVPTPVDLVCDQYLAVSLQKDFEATYKISESLSGHEVIQFWNFGALQSKVPLKNTPLLEFSIAHNHGMVWCMEWCASGYYDTKDRSDSKELRKLGLLALACCDGNIPIYAIGIPQAEQRNKNNIYNIKPAFKLILQEPLDELLGRWKYQATKVSWSKSSGHNVIAGGYSNGVICLWDLENTSPLLKSEEEGVIVLKPYLSFQAHTSAISALVLYPLVDEGKRWLLTGSWDRTFKYWDLNNVSAPISTFGKRGIVTDGVWISHWLCSFFAFDDVFSLGHTVTTVQNPRDFGFKQCSALASNSVVMSLSASEWLSAIAQGTLAGELTTTFPRTILISYDVDKHLKCKRMMLSYNEIIDKTKDVSERKDIMKTEKKQEKNFNEKDDNKLFAWYLADKDSEAYVEEPHTYDKVRQKYGMLFCDFNLKQFHLLPPESLDAVRQSARLREVPTEMYPFTSLNRLVWNPNKQAYLYVACGYQNGFVRLRCVRFMNAHQQ